MNIKNKVLGMSLAVGLIATPQEAHATTRLEYLNNAAVASLGVVAAVYAVKLSSYGGRKVKAFWNYFSDDTKKAALSSLVTLGVIGIANKALKSNMPSDLDCVPDFSGLIKVDTTKKALSER